MKEKPSGLSGEDISKELRRRKIEAIKTGAVLATIITGAGLTSMAPDGSIPKAVGGVILAGTVLYPIAEVVKDEIKYLRGEDLKRR